MPAAEVPSADRPLRADAARNAERIVAAARRAYADLGPEVSTEEIARRAGVGIRTLFRRFPAKRDLARAALDVSVAEHVAPVIGQALTRADAREGLILLLDAAITLAAREHSLLMAAGAAGALTEDVAQPLFAALAALLTRAQEQGGVRADLEPDDLPRILGMVMSTLGSTDPSGPGWRRYSALLLDGITATGAAPLPALEPLARRSPSPVSAWALPTLSESEKTQE